MRKFLTLNLYETGLFYYILATNTKKEKQMSFDGTADEAILAASSFSPPRKMWSIHRPPSPRAIP